MIYLAGLVDSISVLLLLVVFGVFVTYVMQGMANDFDRDWRESMKQRKVRRHLVAAAICLLVLTFVPSKNTIYAIIVSEYGEEIVLSPTGSKAQQALNAWLDKQIAPEK
jgi:amino acid transporter